MLSIAAVLAAPRPDFTAVFPIASDGSSYVEPFSETPELHLVDGKTGKVRKLVGCKFKPATILFSPDGKTVAASSTIGEVCLWSVATGDLVFRAVDADSGHTGALWISLAFSPDGRSLAVGNLRATPRSRTVLEMRAASVWDTRTGKKRSEMQVPGAMEISRICFVNGGRTLRALRFSITDFDPKSGKRQGKEWPRHFDVLSDDGSLASDPTPGWLSVWNVGARKRILHVEDKNPLPISRAIFSPDHGSVAVPRQRTATYADTGMTLTRVELWSLPEGRLRWTSPEMNGWGDPCFSPDGQTVLLPNAQLRKVSSGEVLHSFEPSDRPALGRRGKWILLRKMEIPE